MTLSAVVIGAGHNGLVAANLLADAGWRVLVVEASDRPGGAVASDESLHEGFVTDWFSAFYPLGVASSALRGLELERWGLEWRHAPAVLAHLFPDGRCALLSREPETTAASVDSFAAGDGEAWLRMAERFEQIREPLLAALLGPFPPVRAGTALIHALGSADALRFARFAVQPVRRFTEETFDGAGARALLTGNALHTDLGPDAAGSAIYGWLLAMLGQTVGFPVPAGGSSALTEALCARLRDAGGTIRLGAPAETVEVRGGRKQRGRVRGVRLHGGEFVPARAVLADVDAPQLYRELIGRQHLPERLIADVDRFGWDNATVKINWALSMPIGWTTREVRRAGTVHLGVDLDGMRRYSNALAAQQVPAEPFVILGQMTTADPSRSPRGTESAWAYTHLPRDVRDDPAAAERQLDRIEQLIEQHAPGFRASILTRRAQTPAELEAADRSLSVGALGGGTSALHQQLIFRPVPGLGRADTVIDGLYLASSSAHPGGGVHGAPGANAARAALRRAAATGRVRRAAINAVHRRLYPD